MLSGLCRFQLSLLSHLRRELGLQRLLLLGERRLVRLLRVEGGFLGFRQFTAQLLCVKRRHLLHSGRLGICGVSQLPLQPVLGRHALSQQLTFVVDSQVLLPLLLVGELRLVGFTGTVQVCLLGLDDRVMRLLVLRQLCFQCRRGCGIAFIKVNGKEVTRDTTCSTSTSAENTRSSTACIFSAS